MWSTLIALLYVALHPAPHENMLTLIIHPNLAQLACWWTAECLSSGTVDILIFHQLIESEASYPYLPSSIAALHANLGTANLATPTPTFQSALYQKKKPITNHIPTIPSSKTTPSGDTQVINHKRSNIPMLKLLYDKLIKERATHISHTPTTLFLPKAKTTHTNRGDNVKASQQSLHKWTTSHATVGLRRYSAGHRYK
jgi:hypothetical protein